MTFKQYQKETLRTACGMNRASLKDVNSYILNVVFWE